MAIYTREQVVIDSLQGASQTMTHETIQVTKTATMTNGTLLLANRTEAASGDLAANIVYVIDDVAMTRTNIAVGEVLTVSAVSGLDWVKFNSNALKIGSTALTSGEVTTFAKKTQAV